MRILRAIGPFYVFSGIALGAVGAHLLKAQISPQALLIFEKGVLYQLLNGVALTAITQAQKFPKWPALAIAFGVILFSGSLYLNSAFGLSARLAPSGGMLLMFGWLWLSVSRLFETSRERASKEISRKDI